MATCTTNSVLASSSAIASLPPGLIKVVQASLLASWAQMLDPSIDVTPTALLNSGKCFACLTPHQLKIITAQLMCELV